jgi:hypothetical protein
VFNAENLIWTLKLNFFLDTGVVGTVVGCDGFLFRIERGVIGVLGAGD